MMHGMRLQAATVALAVGVSVGAEAHVSTHSSVLSLWPAQANATLSVKDAPDGDKWNLQASHGSIIAIEAMSTTKLSLPGVAASSIASVQVTWVAPTASSTTWQRLTEALSIPALPVLFSAGVHVHVVTNSAPDGVDVEASVRGLLTELKIVSPSGISKLRSGVFARSLCASTMFTSHQTSASESCFSASFPLDTIPVTPQRTPSTESLPLRVHTVVLSKSNTSGWHFDVDSFSVSETEGRSFDLPRDLLSSAEPDRVVVASNIDESTGVASIGTLTTSGLEATSTKTPLRAASKADVAVSILGEGFHRQVRVRLSTETGFCPAAGKFRVVLPLSTGMYADLDELRRMERFGKLTLHSPAKHIEIERPTAVSSQHAITLDFAADATKALHEFVFPIHLRYQSPTNDSYYSPATMSAPENFISCGENGGVATSVAAAKETPFKTLFPAWVSTHAATDWRRIVPRAPLLVDPVLVPVGFVPHSGLVSALTLSVTSLGAVVLGFVAITSSRASVSLSQSSWRPKRL